MCYTSGPTKIFLLYREGTEVQEVGKILPSIFKRHLQGLDPKLADILGPLWSRVAGKSIAEHSRPVAFEAGILTLATSCPAWAAELRKMAEEIRTEINRFLGGPVVRKLKIEQLMNFDPASLSKRRHDFPLPMETGGPRPAKGKAKNDPRIEGNLRRSLVKNFSRSREREH